MATTRQSRHAFLAPAIVTGYLLTLAELGYRLATHRLGANPIATTLNQLGLLALALLVASLCATPIKLTLGWTWPLRIRRTLGLLAFVSACLHFAVYLGPDSSFDFAEIATDIVRRPFIAVGFVALVLMVPLAWTSTKAAVRRLTFPVWQRLHRVAYVVALLACAHFYMRVRADHTQPLVYLAVLLVGFAIRGVARRRAQGAAARRASSAAQSRSASPMSRE